MRKAFLISDNDGAGNSTGKSLSKKQLRHEELMATLGERYYCLQVREIENLLTPDVLKRTIQRLEGTHNSDIEFLPKFSKAENYRDVYLGKFIELNAKNLKKTYKSDSGTIKDKVNFAKAATEEMLNDNDLSAEASKLAGKLYEFITKNNKF